LEDSPQNYQRGETSKSDFKDTGENDIIYHNEL